MMKIKINGESKRVKTSWSEVTYGEFVQIVALGTDRVKVLAFQLGIPYEELKKARVMGLENVLQALSFIEAQPIINENPKTLGDIEMPRDPSMETIEQFETVKGILKDKDLEHPESFYPDVVAVYYQAAKDGEFKSEEQAVSRETILGFPCEEVLSFGHFFYLRWLSIQTNVPMDSLKAITRPRKKRPVYLRWMRSLDSMVFWIRLRATLIRMTR